MTAFAWYILGFLILIGGLAYGATLLGVAQTWIIVGAIVLLGLGIILGVSSTKRRDPPVGPT